MTMRNLHAGGRPAELMTHRSYLSIHETPVSLLRPEYRISEQDLLRVGDALNTMLGDPESLDWFGHADMVTLIAAQQAGRRAFLMELDVLYCDVIVLRLEQSTGLKAERVSSCVANTLRCVGVPDQ